MKKMLFAPLAIVIALAACSKTEIPAPAGKTVINSQNSSSAKYFVDFNYTLTKDENGNYSCPTPKTDCSKIMPNPALSLKDLDDAITGQTVQTFFNTTGWETKFPYLRDQDAVVHGLQSGDYTMVRKVTHGNVFYIVIAAGANPDNFETSIYTTMVVNE